LLLVITQWGFMLAFRSLPMGTALLRLLLPRRRAWMPGRIVAHPASSRGKKLIAAGMADPRIRIGIEVTAGKPSGNRQQGA